MPEFGTGVTLYNVRYETAEELLVDIFGNSHTDCYCAHSCFGCNAKGWYKRFAKTKVFLNFLLAVFPKSKFAKNQNIFLIFTTFGS